MRASAPAPTRTAPPPPFRARPARPLPAAPAAVSSPTVTPPSTTAGGGGGGGPRGRRDDDQATRVGGSEARHVRRQAAKTDPAQPPLATLLPPADPAAVVDALVVGAGPAGLALASALAARGLTVTLLSRDAPFVNTYGVWVDEFEALGLGATLDATWPAAHCYFGEGAPTVVPRAYGRVDRAALRSVLVQRAADAGVRYLEGDLVEAGPAGAGDAASPLSARTADGAVLAARMVTLACGAAAGRLLTFAPDAPAVAAQTAYGVEATVTGWGAAADESNAPSSPAPAARRAHDPDAMLFMDFRRHHVGVWDGTAPALAPGNHPAGGDGLWGSEAEAPSFLYAMPSPSRHPDDPPGTRRVFLEETCLVARPPLPFATLKRRLHRRLAAAGVAVTDVHDEEWSYIPVGGPLPAPGNALTAFGVAGGLVHPATGYSVARSLAAADGVAAAAAAVLADPTAPPAAAAAAFWGALWPPPARAASAFHVFGMELLARLGPADTNAFFGAFFALPPSLWRGFLSASLSPASLVWFALATFVAAPNSVRGALVRHMLLDPSGRHLIGAYAGLVGGGKGGGEGKKGGGAATAW